jgi:hypothetical protein
MRTLLILLLGATMVSCIDSPSVTVQHPDGTVTTLKLGRNVLGKRQNVVAEATAPGGYGVRQMVQSEDATEVGKSVVRTAGTLGAASIWGGVEENAANNATAEVLGAQGVQKNKDALDAAGKVTSEALPLVPAESIKIGEIKPPGS